MTYMNLIDVCDFQGGSQPPKDKWITQYKDGYIRMLQIRDFTQKRDERDYVEVSNRIKICKKDDVLIARYGASVGKILTGLEGAYNVAIIKSIPSKLIDKRYLYYYFNSSYFQNFLKNVGSRAAQAGFNKEDLREAKIFVPKIEHQRNIVSILNKSKNLIERRKNQIEQLDLLVKSKFIEMFGDPVTNLKKWDKVAIGEMFEIKTGATPSRKENSYWEGGTIPWVKTTELKEYIINETEEYITEDGFNNSSVNLLPKDTILIAMYGQGKTRGMTGKLGIEATTNQACAAILPNNNENMDFVWYQLRLLYDELRALGQGGSQPNLNTNLVKTYQLIFPPVELQNEFERFIKHIDKLKFEIEQSLKELEDNFNSLMQKAFKGELFN
ncbi:restriction endonuclease subunit S [Clostridium perfringens]